MAPPSGHGCCCFGAWSCGHACGAVALLQTAPIVTTFALSHDWPPIRSPFKVEAYTGDFLKPPQRVL